jgi:hypothetical protein
LGPPVMVDGSFIFSDRYNSKGRDSVVVHN